MTGHATLKATRPWRDRARRLLAGRAASVVTGVAVTNSLRIFSSIALTRLLDSSSYGVVGIVTSVAFMIAMLTETGIIPFVIRHERANDRVFLDEVWTIRLVRGALLTLAMIALASPIAAFLGKRYLALVIMAWSFSFLLDGLTSLSFATGVREQRLWRLSLLDMATSVSSICLSIVSAIVLHNYWAMMIGMLGSQALRVVLSYRLFPAAGRMLRFNLDRSREIWAFSRNIALSSALSLFIFQVDKVLLARMMPLAAFGLYAIATTLATAPEAIATPYCGRVLYPAYADAARGARASLGQVFYGLRRRLSLLYAVGVGGLIGGAPVLVGILYDARYAGVALLLRIVAVRVLLRMPNLAAYEATIAVGNTRTGLFANVARAAWLLAGGAAALWRGDPLVMVGVVATDEVPATLWYWFALRRLAILRVTEELLYFASAAIGIGLGAAALQIWEAVRGHAG